MTADPTHRHDQFHRGQVPTGQLADGSADDGFAPISNGDGSVTWGAVSASGSHQHTFDRFVAAGGSPEDFDLTHTPSWGIVQVTVSGVVSDPDDVTLVGQIVSVATVISQIVVVWYAYDPNVPDIPLTFPGDDGSGGGYIEDGNYVSDPFSSDLGDTVRITTDVTAQFFVVDDSGDFFGGTSGPGTFDLTNDFGTDATWRIEAFTGGSYDGGLSGTGAYIVIVP